jgi:hypothetical protein
VLVFECGFRWFWCCFWRPSNQKKSNTQSTQQQQKNTPHRSRFNHFNAPASKKLVSRIVGPAPPEPAV